jgi:ankyrin repeat protein
MLKARFKSGYLIFQLSIILYLSCPVVAISQARPDSSGTDSLWYMKDDLAFNLILAADSGNTDAVLWLLNHGADINAQTDEGVTPLMYAAQNGNLEVVKILVLNGADVNLINIDNVPALMSAVQMQHEEIVDYLLQEGAKPDVADKNQVTSLMYAAAYDYFVIADMLLYYGANPLLQDYTGNDACMVACYNNNLDIAGLLLFNGVPIDTSDLSGNTPLMIAAQRGYDVLCDSLLLWGANPSLRNKNGYTALALAVAAKQLSTVEVLSKHAELVNDRIRKSVQPLDLTHRGDSTYLILKAHGAHHSPWPDFSQFIIGPKFSFNATDYMNGITFGLHDLKYNFSLKTGMEFRVKAKAILVHDDTTTYYQYRERRYTIFATLEKSFNLLTLKESNSVALSAGLDGYYSFGNYRGSTKHGNRLGILSPSLCLQYRQKYFVWSAGYRYADYQLDHVSPRWIEISLTGLIPQKNSVYNRKNIYWLNQ